MPVGGADAAAKSTTTGEQELPPTPEMTAAQAKGTISTGQADRERQGGGAEGGAAGDEQVPDVDLSGAAGAGVEHGPVDSPPGESGYLFGPTQRPTEHVATGASPSGRAAPPRNIGVTLKALNEASQDPSAPGNLHALLRLLNYHLRNQG